MYAYSLRDKTHAAHTMQDNVSSEEKQRRLTEIIDNFRRNVQMKNEKEELGKLSLVLVEGPSTKSTAEMPSLTGRTDGNKRVVFPVATSRGLGSVEPGDYVIVEVKEIKGTTLRSELRGRSSIASFERDKAELLREDKDGMRTIHPTQQRESLQTAQ